MSSTQETRTPWDAASVAEELLARERERREGGRLTDERPGLDLDLAYAAQDVYLARRVGAGKRLVGVKLGLTSVAKQQRMGITAPLTAWLTDAMELEPEQPVEVSSLLHPRVEPEIVFVMGERLAGPGVTTRQALAAVERVHAGLEVIDSRYRDFSFALPDVVADNASSSRFVVSPLSVAPDELDLVLEGCTLSVDGAVAATATGAAVQGHPAAALALAANALAERGLAIEAGQVVLTGGLTDAEHLRPGSVVTAEFATLGRVDLAGV
ncbi:2-keto-4-pentenoate hydratase [Nocardioides bruguierae]|uniref:Fumarylacetoacetate hydrolase family protein n=1 Tax=Nocardioides bruguierae TaxID=2945102 RepID=A0A9X2DB15_9ACTN|nr:fumarylacetoacetate hydrolase family protein [Nocardioides bruguierae]MCM0622309.1 fumarylacetoacetate hydrolase family protein [Nocardioides bruguierae]